MPQVQSKPISIEEANEFFSSLLEMRYRTQEKIEPALENDREAQRYFLCNEVAFFFNKASIKRLWNVIKDDSLFPDKDAGFVMYVASRFDDEAGIHGRPTLMAFAYETEDDGTGHQTIHVLAKNGKRIIFDQDSSKFTLASGQFDADGDGEEHPGGGSIPPPPLNNEAAGSAQKIPLDFPDSSIHAIN